MTDRQKTRATAKRNTTAAPGGNPESDNELTDMRASADRLLGIADSAFERIRSEDSRQHLLRHRQRGGQ